ncbi:hypothetical protein [Planomicrobium okeanokoites]|uniref:hypothetical protein n=1 Tax=Planomicrobium okeanokoites TaxID=244 RepID=UPI000A050BEA|nr:hypothetical protein [Planomicrobium okeanokoites]
MDETQWDLREVKNLKKKQLLQYNLGMLLLFVVLYYFADFEQPYVFIGFFYLLVLIGAASLVYNLKTGKFIGTKTSKRVQEFDKARLGQKRWKRRKILEAAFVFALTIFFTVFIFSTDFTDSGMNSYSAAFPFIGAWIGYNIGEFIRMNTLTDPAEN